MAGTVRVDGRPLRAPGRTLPAGTRIEVAVDPRRLEPPRPSRAVELDPRAILYEDDAIVVVDKPVGLPTVPTADPSRPSLVRALTAFLVAVGRSAGELGVHQRLDADTSGVVLFSKDPRANPGLAAAFAEGGVQKTYEAVTRRPVRMPPQRFTIESRLAARGRAGVASVVAGGRPALTEFEVLEAFAKALLVEARPRTGRKHQIRVHLAEAGLSILGDRLYGGSSAAVPDAPRLLLHARRLALRHPLTGAPLSIESPRPPDFARALEALRLSGRARKRPHSRGR
jgi:RluA family pseudouridine synthase